MSCDATASRQGVADINSSNVNPDKRIDGTAFSNRMKPIYYILGAGGMGKTG